MSVFDTISKINYTYKDMTNRRYLKIPVYETALSKNRLVVC